MGLSGERGHRTGFRPANRANRPAALLLIGSLEIKTGLPQCESSPEK